MMKNLQKMLSKHGLTLSCQSGRKASVLAGLILAAVTAPAAAGAVNWAHQGSGLQSNGAVTVKSLAGGSYAGTQNPAGAVAKANQNAATQPPTVIIQATGSGYAESIPLLNYGASAQSVPSCPSGYSRIWSESRSPGSTGITFNIAGSRYSFGTFWVSSGGGSSQYTGFLVDGLPQVPTSSGSSTPGIAFYAGITLYSAAALCTK
jgi:hypothetical protein